MKGPDMNNSLEFRDYTKKNDIHGTILYPAVMIAPVQKAILSDILITESITSLFDPFHGSGTSLYEAMEISPSLHLVGCDINPLAHLITKVKLDGVDRNIEADLNNLEQYIREPAYVQDFDFPNSDKWFRTDIFESIKLLRTAIINTQSHRNRLYFWYCLCDVIRKFSNTRSSTYKLHLKDDKAITRMDNRVVDSFLSASRRNITKFHKHTKNFILYKNDVLNQIKKFEDMAFDLSITSPPYGDNATTVTYGQFSMLSLFIIDKCDLELEGWELDNYSKIDNQSLGGINSGVVLDQYKGSLVNPYLQQISTSKRKKVIRFFFDYFIFLEELCRVSKKYIVLTLGNRTVDRVQIDLTGITIKFLNDNGFKNIREEQRAIPKKRIPAFTSSVNSRPVSSMNCEHIIVHKRILL